jgi:hypothetical protein
MEEDTPGTAQLPAGIRNLRPSDGTLYRGAENAGATGQRIQPPPIERD